MTNEEKILELLLQMQGDIAGLKAGQAKLEADQAEMKAEICERFDRVDTRFNDMDERFDRVEFSLNQAWKDLSIVEDRVGHHEDIIQKKII